MQDSDTALAIIPKNQIFLVGAVIDESGSMSYVRTETIEGYNAFIEGIKNDQKGKTAYVSTFTFDYKNDQTPILRVIQNGAELENSIPLSLANYSPSGYTPLYDAIGQVIGLMETVVNEKGVEKVTLLIQTDGEENRSRELQHSDVKKLIDDKIAKGWQIIFLGADLNNAKNIGIGLGVSASNSMRYSKSSTGETFRTMSVATAAYRNSESDDADLSLSDDLKREIGDI